MNRTLARLRPWLATLLLLTPLAAHAQDLDADAVLQNVRTTFEAIEDLSFLLTGNLVDPDGTEIPLEIEVALIPGARVASAYVLQPDALADNIIVWNDDAVYNYIYLTNQVTIFDADDQDALGGIFGQDLDESEEFEVTMDLGEVFDGFEATVEDYVDTPVGAAYLIRFVNLEIDANIATATAEIVDGTWLPYSIRLFDGEGSTIATLIFQSVETNVGLAPDEVTFFPEDAEVIDERN